MPFKSKKQKDFLRLAKRDVFEKFKKEEEKQEKKPKKKKPKEEQPEKKLEEEKPKEVKPKQPEKEIKEIDEQELVTPDQPEVIRSGETGKLTGVRLPDGRTFLGLSEENIRGLIENFVGKRELPEGAIEAGTTRKAKEREELVKRLQGIRGERGEELETFEEFKRAPKITRSEIKELKEMGLTDEQIEKVKRGEAEMASGRAGAITGTELGVAASAAVATAGAPAVIGSVAGKVSTTAAASNSAWLATGSKLIAGAGALFAGKSIIDIPNDQIDAMESQAGKVGENSAELVNLARAGRSEEAMRLARANYDMLQEFDEKTVQLAKISAQAKFNPEYIENTRYEYWKSIQEIITTMEEIEIIAANPPEQNLQTLLQISAQQNQLKKSK